MRVNVNNRKPTAEELLEVMRVLRSPKGCPWDREQTRESLRKYLVEETAELTDAIDENNASHICEESGDVLMNLMLQALVAEENGEFNFGDVVKVIFDKMIRRHPHVFGDARANTPGEVVKLWEKVKGDEPEKAARKSLLDAIPKSLPALMRANELQKKAAKAGFDWRTEDGVLAKIDEETLEVKDALATGDPEEIGGELGDLLFAVVNLARFRKLDPEKLLNDCNRKFARRFRHVEEQVEGSGRGWEEFTPEELDEFWNEAKEQERR